MKVLQINSCFGCLSTGRIVSDIATELIASGHDCLAAYGLDFVDRGVPTVKIGTRLGIKFNTLYARLFDREGFGAYFATKRFLKKVDAYKPDVVHLHNLHGNYINIRLLFRYLARHDIPTVLTLHDCWLLTGHCAHFTEIGCEKWKLQCKNCPQLYSYPKSFFVDQSEKNFNEKKEMLGMIPRVTVVSVCGWIADIVGRSHLKNRQCITIHNGIDINQFSPVESNIRNQILKGKNKLVLGVASNWSVKKGLNDFLRLSQMLGDQTQIVLVGLTEAQLEKLPDGVIGIQRTSSVQELAAYYSAADVFVNLSYDDTFSTVNLEAMACGTPVITYDTSGNGEMITQETGCVVPQGDIHRVVDMIEQIPECKLCVKQCQDHAKINFNKKNQAQKYVEIYRN